MVDSHVIIQSLNNKINISNMQNVTIYSTPTCHFCHMAKDFFHDNNIAFTEYDVARDIEKRKEMVEKTGQMGVPVIMVGNETIIGFDKPRLSNLLGIS